MCAPAVVVCLLVIAALRYLYGHNRQQSFYFPFLATIFMAFLVFLGLPETLANKFLITGVLFAEFTFFAASLEWLEDRFHITKIIAEAFGVVHESDTISMKSDRESSAESREAEFSKPVARVSLCSWYVKLAVAFLLLLVPSQALGDEGNSFMAGLKKLGHLLMGQPGPQGSSQQ